MYALLNITQNLYLGLRVVGTIPVECSWVDEYSGSWAVETRNYTRSTPYMCSEKQLDWLFDLNSGKIDNTVPPEVSRYEFGWSLRVVEYLTDNKLWDNIMFIPIINGELNFIRSFGIN